MRSYHKQQVRKGFVLSYTSSTATTDFGTATYYVESQHKPTRNSATHVSTCAMHNELSASPGTSQGLCMNTTDLLCNHDSLAAMKREFKSFRNTTLVAASVAYISNMDAKTKILHALTLIVQLFK